MAKLAKQRFLSELRERVGELRLLPKSQSLLETRAGHVRLYIRYSKRHPGNRTFYGLRQQDLLRLQGYRSFICFIWDDQTDPLFVPFDGYEDLFQSVLPAPDGQYKCQILLRPTGAELYVANAGCFKVESYFGWEKFAQACHSTITQTPPLTHSQIQTLLGAIGAAKGFLVWIPKNDQHSLDWSGVSPFELASRLPSAYENVRSIAEYVDVIWLMKGSSEIQALYEVEHSTSIYSGLLRFNDIHLVSPSLKSRFSIVADDLRRGKFARQVNRPTFRVSGLSDLCSFLDYQDVYEWYQRLCVERPNI